MACRGVAADLVARDFRVIVTDVDAVAADITAKEIGAVGVFRALPAHGAKGGDLGITSSLSVELKKEKIHVHAICPDGVNTQMVADINQDGEARALIAAGKFLQPQEVAGALVDVFGTHRVYRTLPAWRVVLSSQSSLAPGPTMRIEPLIRRMGTRKLTRGLAS